MVFDPVLNAFRYPFPEGEVVIPALSGSPLAGWNRAAAKAQLDALELLQNAENFEQHLDALANFTDVAVDLILDYDVTHAFGARETIVTTRTPVQVHLIWRDLVEHSARS